MRGFEQILQHIFLVGQPGQVGQHFARARVCSQGCPLLFGAHCIGGCLENLDDQNKMSLHVKWCRDLFRTCL